MAPQSLGGIPSDDVTRNSHQKIAVAEKIPKFSTPGGKGKGRRLWRQDQRAAVMAARSKDSGHFKGHRKVPTVPKIFPVQTVRIPTSFIFKSNTMIRNNLRLLSTLTGTREALIMN